MIRSLFSAVSGLTSNQLAMDVIGNNISNLDTVGFKASTVDFSEAFSQVDRIANSSTPIGESVGLGTRVVGTTTDFSQGALQRTDVPSDVAISGNGFFIVSTENISSVSGSISTSVGNTYFTRAGDFVVDINGYLRTPDGFYVQGYAPADTSSVATATSTIGSAIDETTGFGASYLDANGNLVTTVAADYQAAKPPALGIPATSTSLTAIRIPQTIATGVINSGTTPPTVQTEAVTNYSVGTDGAISVVGQDGASVVIGYLPLATVENNAGMSTVGSGYYQATQASGVPTVSQASTGTTGTLQDNALELSNADVATEFSNMIITQNAYNANAKVITTSSQMLQIAVNMVT